MIEDDEEEWPTFITRLTPYKNCLVITQLTGEGTPIPGTEAAIAWNTIDRLRLQAEEDAPFKLVDMSTCEHSNLTH